MMHPLLTWTEFGTGAFVVIDLLIKFVAIGLVPENRHPSSSSAWLLLILLVPVIGLPLFLLLGSPRVSRRRHRIQAAANQRLTELLADAPDFPPAVRLDPELATLTHLNRRLTSLPAVLGRNEGLFGDYEESIRAMAASVDLAERFVHAEFYAMSLDETTAVFIEALARAADRGVTVRVLYDHLGSRRYPGYQPMLRTFAEHGVEVNAMMPLRPLRGRWRRPDLRNHRKLLVVDSHTAFMGSQNMIDAIYQRPAARRYRDISVKLSGPIVRALDSVFAVDWFTESGEHIEVAEPIEVPEWPEESGKLSLMQLVPSGPGFDTEPNLRLFTALIHQARERVELISPYFVPDESLLAAITTAAYRGVAVELFVSEKSDGPTTEYAQRSYYGALLDAGVRIWRWPAPDILHAKYLTIDEEVAVLGSSNMDMRSFGLNYEIMLMTTAGDLDDDLRALTESYRAGSRELVASEWSGRPWWQRYLENVMRLSSAVQ